MHLENKSRLAEDSLRSLPSDESLGTELLANCDDALLLDDKA